MECEKAKKLEKLLKTYSSREFHKKLIIKEIRNDLINIYSDITNLSYEINELKDKTNELLNHNDKFLSSAVNNLDNNNSPSLISQNKLVSASNISCVNILKVWMFYFLLNALKL